MTTLIDKVQNAGRYKINWNANEFSSGIYFYKLFAMPVTGQREYIAVKKMLLLK